MSSNEKNQRPAGDTTDWPNVKPFPTHAASASTPGGNQSAEGARNEHEDGVVGIIQLLNLLRKHWLVLTVVVFASFIGSVLWTMQQPKIYRTQASIIINSRAPRVLTQVQDVNPAGGGNYWATEYFYRTEYKVLESRMVADRAGEILNLQTDDENNGLAKIRDDIEREEARKAMDVGAMVRGMYQIEPDKKSRVTRVYVEHRNPVFAAKVANAVSQAYLEQNLDQRTSSTREASTWLSVQHRDLKTKLEDSEKALFDFMADNNVLNASMESQEEEVRQRLKEFNSRLAEVQAERISSSLGVEALRKARADATLLDSLDEVRKTPIIGELKSRLVELSGQRSDLETRYKKAHPKILTINRQIALVEKNLAQEVDGVLVGLERQADSLQTTEQGLKDAIQREKSKEAFLNRLKLDHIRLKREVETNKRLFDLVTGRLKETDLSGMLRVNNAFVLDEAEVPTQPFKPSMKRNGFLGAILGILLSALMIVVLEMLDNTLRSPQDVQDVLETAFLGILPVIDESQDHLEGVKVPTTEMVKKTAHRDFYILEKPKSMAAECIRSIRTNLLFMSPERKLESMVVTSAIPQEGKTTTAISLAITMAQSGSRTLLVDTDMRRPRLHRSFGLKNEMGITSTIVGDKTIDEVIQSSGIEDLDLLVCGPVPPNPAELLHTNRFVEIVEELKRKYDRVIFDSPPVGAVTDPVILSTLVDGTVLVVKSGKTTRVLGRQAMRSLRDANVNVLGAILNDVAVSNKKYGYYYSKYYRYGTYYGRYYGPYGSEEDEESNSDEQTKNTA